MGEWSEEKKEEIRKEEKVARSKEVREEGPRYDGRSSEKSSETGRVSGQKTWGPAAIHPGLRISLPHVP